MISKRQPLYFLFIIYPRGGSWSVNSPRRNFHHERLDLEGRGENPRGKVGISTFIGRKEGREVKNSAGFFGGNYSIHGFVR